MHVQTLANRMGILERKVEGLEQFPERVASLELQISRFRREVHVEFSTVRGEMKEFHGIAMNRIHERQTEMRVLHEEVISRIALLNEGGNRRRGGNRRAQKR